MFPYDSDDSAARRPAHTPGPWVIYDGMRRDCGDVSIYDAKGVRGRWLANIHGDHVGPLYEAEILANARLIAAAPDLLAALRKIATKYEMTSYDDAQDAVEDFEAIARAAVKLAEEGRS